MLNGFWVKPKKALYILTGLRGRGSELQDCSHFITHGETAQWDNWLERTESPVTGGYEEGGGAGLSGFSGFSPGLGAALTGLISTWALRPSSRGWPSTAP